MAAAADAAAASSSAFFLRAASASASAFAVAAAVAAAVAVAVADAAAAISGFMVSLSLMTSLSSKSSGFKSFVSTVEPDSLFLSFNFFINAFLASSYEKSSLSSVSSCSRTLLMSLSRFVSSFNIVGSGFNVLDSFII